MILATVWGLQSKVLENKMYPFDAQVRGPNAARAHHRFLKDVLYGLHVFTIDDPCSSLWETVRRHTFSPIAQTASPRPQKGFPEPFKRDPKTLLWSLRKPLENAPKTEHQKKSLFAPATDRGICWFRALDPGNGTPVIYRYVYIYT